MARTQKKQIKSKTFGVNTGIEKWYRRELRTLTDKMLNDVSKSIIDIYSSKKEDVSFDNGVTLDAGVELSTAIQDKLQEMLRKYNKIYKDNSVEIAKRMVARVTRFAKSNFRDAMKGILPESDFTLRGSVIPKEMEQSIKASVMENVSLIKSIQEKYFNEVTGAVTRSMQAGGNIKQLKQEISKYNGMTKRRADIIANDQSKKAYTSITLRHFQKYGIRKAEWVHSGGGQHPREYHKTQWNGNSITEPNGLNGLVFDIDRPPIIDQKTGERGYPSQLPNCKCIMRAVVDIEPI